MAEFTKKIINFLSEINEFEQKWLRPMPASASRMTPGNVLVFTYPQSSRIRKDRTQHPGIQRICLIVRIKRGDGVFKSTRDNTLVAVFELNNESSTVVEIILENLYKKRRRSSYYGKIKESLVSLLGVDSFRTFNLEMMRAIYQVYLGKERPKAR